MAIRRDRSANAPVVARRRLQVIGVVQGVGFRPFVYRLARELDLKGSVTNESSRVVIDVSGPEHLLDGFQQRLIDEAPPLSAIESISVEQLPMERQSTVAGFSISDSRVGAHDRVSIPVDTAVCEHCRRDMEDPSNRRYRYPFISCTDCGPRFTIIESLPYDRPATTMAGFELCSECDREYHDPGDRRFHAQPIGCHHCGPVLRFEHDGAVDESGFADPIAPARQLLVDGGHLVVKGVGGFQIACDAGNEAAVVGLRRWKRRPDKPLALLVSDLAMAERLVVVDDHERGLLTSPARPIVVAERRALGESDGRPAIADAVAGTGATAQPRLGVMLPASPLHELLARAVGRPLVLTSGNLAGRPICHRDDDLDALLAAADGPAVGLLTHNRPIAVPCDDSVVRISPHGPIVIRRARGYSPTAVDLGASGQAVLAAGGLLKNTFCLTGSSQAWVSQHVGDLDDLDTLETFAAGIERFERFYQVAPSAVAVDAHPDFTNRTWVRRNRSQLPVVEVQHHHAHIASVLAEQGIDPTVPVIGVAFDGTGYGWTDDGTAAVWGGEFLLVIGGSAHRVGHLEPLLMPGGDSAVINPYRAALAYLHHAGCLAGVAGGDGVDGSDLAPWSAAGETERAVIVRQLERGIGCLPNTSMGRLFDAISSIVGLRHRISYEAQGAIELETAATRYAATRNRDESGPTYDFGLAHRPGPGGPTVVADPCPVVRAVVDDVRRGRPVEAIAYGFHLAVVELVVSIVEQLRDRLATGADQGASDTAVDTASDTAIDTVVLSGGVFQNALLTDTLMETLSVRGWRALTNRIVPPNDGGLALGQAYIARARLLTSSSEPVPGANPCA